MHKKILLTLTMSIGLITQAAVHGTSSQMSSQDSITSSNIIAEQSLLQPLAPTYLPGVSAASGWGANWFISAAGGVSVLAGTPAGCASFKDRLSPSMTFHAGKWFTPAVGARLSAQGFDLKGMCWQSISYKMGHADLMYNITSNITPKLPYPRWIVAPYVGGGLIHNDENGRNSFMLSYGIIGGYRFAKRFTVNLEASGVTAFRDFDGIGAQGKLGDNIFSLSAGLTLSLGKCGWTRIVDPYPYMQQNEWLSDYAQQISQSNNQLKLRNVKDARTIEELKKILEIEGLLDKYGDQLRALNSDIDLPYHVNRNGPTNNYSGLNSLMARLKNKWLNSNKSNGDGDQNGRNDVVAGTTHAGDSIIVDSATPSDQNAWSDYLYTMSANRECIGAPIYFFFKINTTTLNDPNQLINLDAIARVAKKHDLRIRVTGAADSATGTRMRNKVLSTDRAQFIYEQLKARGLDERHIARVAVGGIDEFAPEGNRNTKVELFFEPPKEW